MRYRSSAPRPVMATQSAATWVVPPWVWTTPLGTPVVPEVNRMSHGSSGVTAADRRSTSARPSGVARAANASHDSVPPGAGPRATTTVSRSGSSVPVAAQHGHVVGAEEVGDGHQDPGPAAGQDVGRLGPLEARVHRDEHGPGAGQAEEGHDPLGAVEGPDGDSVARLHARGDEGGAEGPGPVGQFGVGEPAPVLDHGGAVAEPLGGGGDDRRDGVRLGGGGHRAALASTTAGRRRPDGRDVGNCGRWRRQWVPRRCENLLTSKGEYCS